MGAAILEQLQNLPEPMQQKALQYIETLVAEHHQGEKNAPGMSRKDAFGIWKDQIWMAEDFDAPLEDLKEYM
jgi:Protein of unknown function (DUF2281)